MNITLLDYITEKYNNLSLQNKEELYLLFNTTNDIDLKEKLEQIIYYKKPPTPEEFLDPQQKWLPASFIYSTYDWVKESFLEILNEKKKYNQIVLYGATRIGKTYLALLLMIYTIVYIHYLREPALFYGLSPLTKLAMYIISFKYDKTKELYLDPLFNILQQSERFVQVKFQDQVIPKQKEIGIDKIVYSKATTTGEITLASGLQLQLGNDEALAFIGANILSAYVSEIAFWIEHEGVTEDTIFRVYSDLLDRIKATVGRDYLTYLFLDTSANYSESKIEKHILQNLQYKEGVYFKWQNRWTALPNNGKNFPEYHKTGKTFKVITGNAQIPPQIVYSDTQLIDVPKDLIIDVPIDVYDEFNTNLIKAIKDIAGIPTQRENKFISNGRYIEEMFLDFLPSVQQSLIADASQQPEYLLFNQIKDIILIPYKDRYIFKRAPQERRYIGIDNAYSLKGDMMGFCILHKEFSKEKNTVIYVIDCCFPVIGKDTGINLDAPIILVYDLLQKVNTYIHGIYADTFQSANQMQTAQRKNLQFIQQSVDKTLAPYQFFLTCLTNGLIKAGKNIFLKNNLQCLIITRTESGKEKIDHPINKSSVVKYYDGNWETSTAGLYGKDVSDAVCQALWGAYNDMSYIPCTIYEEENKRFIQNITNKDDIIKAYKLLKKDDYIPQPKEKIIF